MVVVVVVLAHPGSPGQRAIKRVCVCVCVYEFLRQTTSDMARIQNEIMQINIWTNCSNMLIKLQVNL